MDWPVHVCMGESARQFAHARHARPPQSRDLHSRKNIPHIIKIIAVLSPRAEIIHVKDTMNIFTNRKLHNL